MRYGDLIDRMTLEEKAKLCVGKDFWHTVGIERLGIPEITMSDGPHGLRVQKDEVDNLGIHKSEVATCFPALSTIANSWDRNTAYQMGDALGREAKASGIDILLGPAINIKRSPLCGRNFEYLSEDPYLTGVLGAEYVKGLQNHNVGACVKHFAVNNQENRRRTIDAVVDERTLREIYLKAFEMIVKESNPVSVMSAYNKINGDFCSENKYLIDILRDEWGFDGIVITDWGAENDRVKGVIAGNELEMPGGNTANVVKIIDAVHTGKIKEEALDELVDRIMRIAFSFKKNDVSVDLEAEHKIAEELARESIVLLKNEDDILPIEAKKIALIGEMARVPRYQGAGSSLVNTYRVDNAEETFKKYGVECEYAQGYTRVGSEYEEQLLMEAIEVASRNDIAIIYVGLTEGYESEGIDRFSLYIPRVQDRLIEEVTKVNSNVIVVLSQGSPVLMPWKDKVKGIITGYLGGETGEKAMVECILGEINPNGKLAETFPLSLEDTPCANYYPGNDVYTAYKEGIFVGYRYYDTYNKDVLFPFGYGLSYTKFGYSILNVTEEDNGYEISFDITNIGKRSGKEIAQIYISHKDSKTYMPQKELKWFDKFFIKRGDTIRVVAHIDKDEFRYFDINEHKWKLENGTYEIMVGRSSRDIAIRKEIVINDVEELPRLFEPTNIYKRDDIHNISDSEFEKLLYKRLPMDHFEFEELSEENTLENFKDTKVGKALLENEKKKMQNLLDCERINDAVKVMMDLQKPIKKFYEKAGSPFTKGMIDEFIYIAKNNLEYENSDFYSMYIKRDVHW